MSVNLLNLTPAQAEQTLREFAVARGVEPYRGSQATNHLWIAPKNGFAEMSDVPVAFRNALAEAFTMPRLTLDFRQRSSDGTEKFLFRLHDGQAIESVAIPEKKRLTLCISSQAGCALQCAFCATGAMGFARNLEPYEIAGQVRELLLLDPPIKPTNIVFMGMGEPFMNWKSVDTALTILNSPKGLAIGARHITVSTVGVLPGIEALAQRREQFRLAFSIHAPNDAMRHALMPINTKYPLATVLEAARKFQRRVTFEYVMLGGVNDQPAHARELAVHARACGAFVNLIPLHPGGAGHFAASSPEATARFERVLREAGVEVAVRKSRGLDIAAACGQLRVERLRRRPPIAAKEDTHVEVATGVEVDHDAGNT
jgi:23S rRNA (adenine2503-C2)-methyltransferase